MASRFWVGGTGTWDAADTTHWSATSGGVGGASVPGVVDDVHVDAASGVGTITLATAPDILSIDFTGFTGTLAQGSNTLTLAGSATLAAGMTYTATAAIVFHSAAIGTLTTNGKTLAGLVIGGGSAGGTITLGDALTVSGTVNLTSGTINTNGKTCNWGAFNANNSNTRVITLGASAITITGTGIPWDCTTATGLTVTASTATITMTGAAPTFRSGGRVWTGLSLIFNGFTGIAVISGNGTFANVTVTGPATKTSSFNISTGTTTVTGTLTINGNSLTNRILFNANGTPGLGVSISAAVVALSNVDFSDVTGLGVAAPFTGSSLGDAQGNSGITFTAPVARFAVAAGNWSSTATWSATSGGAPGASVPLPQDAVKLDAAAAVGTYTADMPRIGKDIDFTGFTRTFTHAIGITYYGSWTASATMTWNGSGGIVCASRASVTFTTAGKTTPTGLTMSGPGGTLTLLDDLTGNSAITLGLTDGTIDANGKNVSYGVFQSTSNRTRSLILGSGAWTLTGTGTVWNVTASAMTFTAGATTISITDTSASTKTFTGAGLVYPTLRYRPTGTGNLAINGANVFANLDVECSSARSLILQAGTTQFVLATTTLLGTATATLSISSSAVGSQAGLWSAIGGTLTQAFVSASADVVVTTGQNLAQVDAITDATRAAAAAWGTGQQTGQVDGATIPGGFYVGRTATNLHPRGQCDAIGSANWARAVAGTGTGPVIDATVPFPNTPQSMRVDCNGTGTEAIVGRTNTGLALAAGTAVVGSIMFQGTAGVSYRHQIRIQNTDATTDNGTSTNFVATGAPQLLIPVAFAIQTGKVGDAIRIDVAQNVAAIESIWAAEPMIESGHSTVAPYVPTSGGVTSTRTAGRIQIGVPSTPTSFWWAAKMVMGFAAADTESFRTVAAWESPSGFDGFQLTWRSSSPRWKMQVTQNNSSQNATIAAAGFTNPGDAVLAVGQASYDAGANRWTLRVSINGSPFTAFVCPVGFSPAQAALPFFDVGNIRGNQQIDSRTSWFASGLGYTLTDADAAALAALPTHDPSFAGLPSALRASVNALAPMDTVAYEIPLSLVSAPVLT